MKKRKNKKLFDLREGESRVFFNFHKGSENVSFGLPKSDSKRSDVYVKVNGKEMPRMSINEAKGYLSQGMQKVLSSQVKGLDQGSKPKQLSYSGSQEYASCSGCSKRIKKDYKKLCYDCWKKSNP